MADFNGCQRRNHSIAKPHNPRTVRQWRSLKNWKKEKCQMTTGKCQISKPKWRNLWESGKTSSDHETRTLSEKEFGKGALSANDIFSTTTPGGPEQLQTQFWAEDGLIAGIVEKIWLSREERLFRRSWVISGAQGNSGNRPESVEAKEQGSSAA